MIIYIASFDTQGKKTGERLFRELEVQSPGAFHFHWKREDEKTQDFTAEAFHYHLPLLFIGAAGICVRMISPYVLDKTTDSPVLVMDEKGSYVIPILSGHLGGANELAAICAGALGGQAVITTASDVNGTFAVDVFARRNGLAIRNREGIMKVTRKALAGEKILMRVDPEIRVSASDQPADVRLVKKGPADVVLSEEEPGREGESAMDVLWLSPRTSVAGIGCRRGKTFEELNDYLLQTLGEMHGGMSPEDYIRLHVRAIASIDRKADEEGLEILAEYYHLPLVTYTAKELGEVPGEFGASEFVKEVTGVANVCERAAVRAAMDFGGEHLVFGKKAGDGITIAEAAGNPGIVTFATGALPA